MVKCMANIDCEDKDKFFCLIFIMTKNVLHVKAH